MCRRSNRYRSLNLIIIIILSSSCNHNQSLPSFCSSASLSPAMTSPQSVVEDLFGQRKTPTIPEKLWVSFTPKPGLNNVSMNVDALFKTYKNAKLPE
jgi:hypothetical protein